MFIIFTYHKERIKENNMPNGDKTGPQGKGPRTGRGLGQSIGNKSGRDQENGNSRGQATGRGMGQGRGNRRP